MIVIFVFFWSVTHWYENNYKLSIDSVYWQYCTHCLCSCHKNTHTLILSHSLSLCANPNKHRWNTVRAGKCNSNLFLLLVSSIIAVHMKCILLYSVVWLTSYDFTWFLRGPTIWHKPDTCKHILSIVTYFPLTIECGSRWSIKCIRKNSIGTRIGIFCAKIDILSKYVFFRFLKCSVFVRHSVRNYYKNCCTIETFSYQKNLTEFKSVFSWHLWW